MKLKTNCTPHIISGSTDDFSHDAAVAHALLASIDYYGPDDSVCLSESQARMLKKRAQKLLKNWGYGDTAHPQNTGVAGDGEVGK